jgi:hypothetical protein
MTGHTSRPAPASSALSTQASLTAPAVAAGLIRARALILTTPMIAVGISVPHIGNAIAAPLDANGSKLDNRKDRQKTDQAVQPTAATTV